MAPRSSRKYAATLRIDGKNLHCNSSDDLVYYGSTKTNDKPLHTHVIICQEWRTFPEYKDFVSSFFPDVDVRLLHKLWSNSKSWIASVDIIRSLHQCRLLSVSANVDNFATFNCNSQNWPPIVNIPSSYLNTKFNFSNSEQDDKSSGDDSWTVVEHDASLEWEFLSIFDGPSDDSSEGDTLSPIIERNVMTPVKTTLLKISYKDALMKTNNEGKDADKISQVSDFYAKSHRIPWNPVILVVDLPTRRPDVTYGNTSTDIDEVNSMYETVDTFYEHKFYVGVARVRNNDITRLPQKQAEKKLLRIAAKGARS